MKERHDGGIGCGRVLASLSEFVDGTLDAATRKQIDAHLDGCDNCRHFGEDFVGMLRSTAEVPGALQEELVARIGAALDDPSDEGTST